MAGKIGLCEPVTENAIGVSTNPIKVSQVGIGQTQITDANGNPVTVTGGALTVTGAGGGGAATIADGADVCEGTTTDVKVVGDNSGTVSAKLRGINTALAGTLVANVAQWNGNTVSTNEGPASAGVVRVVPSNLAVLNVGQITVGTAATLVLASNSNRHKLVVTPQAATAVYFGTSTAVTTANGDGVPAIAGFPWATRYNGAVYGIGSASVVVTYREESAS